MEKIARAFFASADRKKEKPRISDDTGAGVGARLRIWPNWKRYTGINGARGQKPYRICKSARSYISLACGRIFNAVRSFVRIATNIFKCDMNIIRRLGATGVFSTSIRGWKFAINHAKFKNTEGYVPGERQSRGKRKSTKLARISICNTNIHDWYTAAI